MRRNRLSCKDEISFVDDMPFNHLAFDEAHRLCDRCWEVDVPLIGSVLTLYVLNFCWVAHDNSFLDNLVSILVY
jgi:hypothetical protein